MAPETFWGIFELAGFTNSFGPEAIQVEMLNSNELVKQ